MKRSSVIQKLWMQKLDKEVVALVGKWSLDWESGAEACLRSSIDGVHSGFRAFSKLSGVCDIENAK